MMLATIVHCLIAVPVLVSSETPSVRRARVGSASLAVSGHDRVDDDQVYVRHQKQKSVTSQLNSVRSEGPMLQPNSSFAPTDDGRMSGDVDADKDEAGAHVVQGVRAWADPDGSLSASFEHQGRQYLYEQLLPHNVYTTDAEVYLGGNLIKLAPPRIYRLREEGKRAYLTWHEDGTVEGLFEDSEHVMSITPVSRQPDHVAASLLQGYSGAFPPHVIQLVSPFLLSKQAFVPGNMSDTESIPQASLAMGSWNGQRWYPGCYGGDSRLHTMIVGFASDSKALERKGGSTSRLQSELASIINRASFVYEKQMNIELKMGRLDMAKRADEWQGGCSPWDGSDMTRNKLQAMRDAISRKKVPTFASSHLFTGCGESSGQQGRAYLDGLCDGPDGSGVNKIHSSDGAWRVFAHELGHNLDGEHSFEEGQGSTGGIMDYGSGKLNGEYQFHTKYRKREMCSCLNKNVGRCNGKFAAGGGGTTPTRRRRTPTTPTRRRRTNSACVRGWEGGDGTGGSETEVGTASTRDACVGIVQAQQRKANGATWGTRDRKCYAEFGMSGFKSDSRYTTCQFGGGGGPTRRRRSPSSPTRRRRTPSCAGKKDKHKKCAKWARKGLCVKSWHKSTCPLSCC